MKKTLTILTAVGFLSTSIATFSQTNLAVLSEDKLVQELDSGVYSWTNITISHEVQTTSELWVTDEKSNEKTDNSAVSKKTWDEVLSNTKKIMSSGYIALHTYTSPKYLNDVILNLNPTKSNNLQRVWEFNDINDVWKGTGHHTSSVTLTVIAKYHEQEQVASIMYKSSIYARTAGSAHSCSTTSQIKSAIFIGV